MATDYYAVLGVTRDADPTELRRAYHRRARALHPDLNPDRDGTAFRELTDAFQVLSDPASRRRVDCGQDPHPTPAPRPTPGPASAPSRATSTEEISQAVNGMLLQGGIVLVNLIIVIAAMAASCQPDTPTYSYQSPNDPFIGVPNAWIGRDPCLLMDPADAGLGAGKTDTEADGETSFCVYDQPPAAPGYWVSVSVSADPDPATSTLGRHRVDIARSFDPGYYPEERHGEITQDPRMVVVVNIYPKNTGLTNQLDRPVVDQLLSAILTNIEQHLPPPT